MVRSLTVLAALALATPAAAGSWGKEAESTWGKAGNTVGEVAVGKRLSVGDPVVVGQMALYPVIDRDASARPDLQAVPLARAMATGQLEVREVAGGVVSQVAMINHGDEPVLVMQGDLVDGGRQDRVVTRSLLVASGQPMRVPVHCVEKGRWDANTDAGFAYGGRVDPVVRGVVQRAASQDATWDAVARANTAKGVDGSASWLEGAGVDPRKVAALEGALRQRFEDDKRVVGVMVARNGRFHQPEVYGHPALFAQDRINVLRSHVAMTSTPMDGAVASAEVPSAHDAAAFLQRTLAD
ncbi:MAG: hypothetical protein KTR31_11445 [Myxococcales bacterium]|nr:hypothetical protein [Myxococcales bacterium]